MNKVVATDMDGTFLDGHHSYDRKRLRDLLEEFNKKNYLFAVASGRAMIALEKVFAGFEDDIAFIAENGSLVTYKGEILFEAKMEKVIYLDLVEQLKALPDMTGFLLSGRQGAYATPDVSPDYVSFISNYYENVQVVEDLSTIEDDIFKLTVNFTEETILEREAWLNENLNGLVAMTTGFKSLDVILDHVDKSTGLRGLCDKFGLAATDVVAFGDNMNDYQMLQFAGTAIATENARDEIKAISQEVIGHCEEESVMAYMEGMVR